MRATHRMMGLKHEKNLLVTKRDYSQQAQLLGNGGHFVGEFDFYVAVCPSCNHNDEYDGCPNCHHHGAHIGVVGIGTLLSIACPFCAYGENLNLRCSNCGA